MAEPWFKVGTEINRNPKIGQVGAEGLVVFLELLAAVTRGDRDGVIPARYASSEHLAGLLFLFKLRPRRVEKCLDLLESGPDRATSDRRLLRFRSGRLLAAALLAG